MQIFQYLAIGLILIMSSTGNKVTFANRTQGVRRVWEVKAIWSGADVAGGSDYITTSTGQTIVRKIAKSDLKINNKQFNFLIETPLVLTKGGGSPLIAHADKTEKSYSALSRSNGTISLNCAATSENKVSAPQQNNKLTGQNEAAEQVILVIKQTLRYLERLPGH